MKQEYCIFTGCYGLVSPFKFTKKKAEKLARNMDKLVKDNIHFALKIGNKQINNFLPYKEFAHADSVSMHLKEHEK